jgi:hypothetical protein
MGNKDRWSEDAAVLRSTVSGLETLPWHQQTEHTCYTCYAAARLQNRRLMRTLQPRNVVFAVCSPFCPFVVCRSKFQACARCICWRCVADDALVQYIGASGAWRASTPRDAEIVAGRRCSHLLHATRMRPAGSLPEGKLEQRITQQEDSLAHPYVTTPRRLHSLIATRKLAA